MKKNVTYFFFLFGLFLSSPVSADWFINQMELIKNYRSFENLKEQHPSKPESNLPKGKYESESDYNTRLENARTPIVRRFFIEDEAKFDVPNNDNVVNFSYSPFDRITITENISFESAEGQNAFGAKSTIFVSRGSRKVFEPNKFDTQWPAKFTILSIDKEYLIKEDADIIFIKIIDMDISDPDNFIIDYDTRVANRNDAIPEERLINETVLKGNVVASGFYDKKNDNVIGVFSPNYDRFYHLYNNQVDNLSKQTKTVEFRNFKTRLSKEDLSWTIPIYVPQPKYPRRAQSRGKEGYAVIQVILTAAGGVRDPILIEEWPEGWGFGRSALKAANKLKYNPRIVDGVAKEVPGVIYKFTFNMTQ
jgi:TonB family protein